MSFENKHEFRIGHFLSWRKVKVTPLFLESSSKPFCNYSLTMNVNGSEKRFRKVISYKKEINRINWD